MSAAMIRNLHTLPAILAATNSAVTCPRLSRESLYYLSSSIRSFSSHSHSTSKSSNPSHNNDSTHHRQPTSRVIGLDYYALLEVHRHHLSDGDLKAAYYRLAKQYHPDRLIDLPEEKRVAAEKKFAQIGVAYAVLSDPIKRQQYDIFSDLSSIGDQDRMLHWVKINRPPDQIGAADFEYGKGFTPKDKSATTKPKVEMPVFRSS